MFPGPAANIVFIGAEVTFDTVGVFADAFLDVLAANVLRAVFVAAITGVATVIVAHVAGYAFGSVVAVKHEELVVVEGRRLPLLLAVTLRAIVTDLLMKRVGWRCVASLALSARRRVQQGMVEMPLWPEALHPCVITVAGHTVLVD